MDDYRTNMLLVAHCTSLTRLYFVHSIQAKRTIVFLHEIGVTTSGPVRGTLTSMATAATIRPASIATFAAGIYIGFEGGSGTEGFEVDSVAAGGLLCSAGVSLDMGFISINWVYENVDCNNTPLGLFTLC